MIQEVNPSRNTMAVLAEPLLGGRTPSLLAPAYGTLDWPSHFDCLDCYCVGYYKLWKSRMVWILTALEWSLSRIDRSYDCTGDDVSNILQFPSIRGVHYCRHNQCLHLVAMVSTNKV